MQELAWINGKITPLAEACVPLEDRGFIFGDGVYEACRIYNGIPYLLDAHLARFERSAAAILLGLPPAGDLREAAADLIAASGCREGWLYLQVTRGHAPRAHPFPANTPPTAIMFVRELPQDVRESVPQRGVSCLTLPDERWLHCHIKSISLLANVLAKEKAKRAGCFEAIFYRPGEVVTEGSSSNVFAVLDGVIRTHPLSNLILAGITRAVVLEILEEEGIRYSEEPFTVPEMKSAAEVWTCSSIAEISPVTAIDGTSIGGGTPGEIFRLVCGRYRDRVLRDCAS